LEARRYLGNYLLLLLPSFTFSPPAAEHCPAYLVNGVAKPNLIRCIGGRLFWLVRAS
jgi:hypothetical protein